MNLWPEQEAPLADAFDAADSGRLVVYRRWNDGPVLDGTGCEVSAAHLEALEREGAQLVIIHRRVVTP